MLKKVFATLVAVTMCLSVSASAFAEDTPKKPSFEIKETVEYTELDGNDWAANEGENLGEWLFSNKHIRIDKKTISDDYGEYTFSTYVFPVGTVAAYKIDGELCNIQLEQKNIYDVYEIILTEEMIGMDLQLGGGAKGSEIYIILEGSDTTSTSAPVTQSTNPNTQTPQAKQATPTASKIFINGKNVSFEAYTIDGNNFFKLRDLAFSVNGTEKQFDVSFDSTANAINLISNKPYLVATGEMAKGDGKAKTAQATTSKVLLDGKEISLNAYNIKGNNYLKLRDIGKAFNFAVDWDGANNAIQIDTSKPYIE